MNPTSSRTWIRLGGSSMRRTAVPMMRIALAAAMGLLGCKGGERPRFGPDELVRLMTPGKKGSDGLAYEIVYRLYVPRAAKPSRLYPLIVVLHGSGVNGSDNRRHLSPELGLVIRRAQEVEPTFVLAPQCPEGDKWVTGDRGTPHLNYSQDVRKRSDASTLVLRLIEELESRYPIDPSRLYVTGYSSGGAGTWDIVSRDESTIFAAAAPMTGTNDPSRAGVIRSLPIWAFHGGADTTSPTDNTREMVQALRGLGSSVRYTEYPGVGHNVWSRAYREPELVPWLLAQKRDRPPATAPAR